MQRRAFHVMCLAIFVSLPAFGQATGLTAAELQEENISLRAEILNLQSKIKKLEAELADLKTLTDTAGIADADPSDPAPGVAPLQWEVRVASVTPVDTTEQKAQLLTEQEMLKSLNTQLTAARNKSNEMQSERRTTYENGRNWTVNPNTPAALGAARADVNRLEDTVRRSNGKIARLQREIQDGVGKSIVVGTLPDGAIVNLEGGDVASNRAVSAMQVGTVYTVKGTSRQDGGSILIRVRSVIERAN